MSVNSLNISVFKKMNEVAYTAGKYLLWDKTNV